MVLAACHSLVVVEDDTPVTATATNTPSAHTGTHTDSHTDTASGAGSGTSAPSAQTKSGSNLVGDPIELAAMKGKSINLLYYHVMILFLFYFCSYFQCHFYHRYRILFLFPLQFLSLLHLNF